MWTVRGGSRTVRVPRQSRDRPVPGGLRLAQAKNCREFLVAAMSGRRRQRISSAATWTTTSLASAALSPARKGWNGRLPVPGGGQYEWQGFRKDLPSELNPARGFIATANHNINPPGYTPPLMFKNADTRFERITRLLQIFASGPPKLTLEDHQRMQHDALSLRALADLPAFAGGTRQTPRSSASAPRSRLGRRTTRRQPRRRPLRELARRPGRRGSRPWRGRRGRPWPRRRRGRGDARRGRDAAEGDSAGEPEPRSTVGAAAYACLPASAAAHVRSRSGGAQRRGGTVEADGASYREIFDVANWDRSLVINVPGQSGQPGSPFYDHLLPLWTENGYFPLAFSDRAVAGAAKYRLTLRPR